MINETLSCLTVACPLPALPPLCKCFCCFAVQLVKCFPRFFRCFALFLPPLVLCVCVLSGLKVVRELSALHIAAQNWHCHLQIHFYLYLNEFIVAVNGHKAFTSCPKKTRLTLAAAAAAAHKSAAPRGVRENSGSCGRERGARGCLSSLT